MQQRSIFIIALVFVLGAAGVVVSQRVLSQRNPSIPAYADVTPAPMATHLPIQIGSPLPNPPTFETTPFPTSLPLPTVAKPNALASTANLLFEATFDTTELKNWEFNQIYRDPVSPPAWGVKNGQLISPDNASATNSFNDLLALPSTTLAQNGAIEVSAMAGNATKVGLLLGYQDNQNYVALIFGSQYAPRWKGLQIVQFVHGEPTVLAQNPETLLQQDRWYRLRMSLEGPKVTATVDDQTSLTAVLNAAPATNAKLGLYAGSEGFAFFDYLRIIGQ